MKSSRYHIGLSRGYNDFGTSSSRPYSSNVPGLHCKAWHCPLEVSVLWKRSCFDSGCWNARLWLKIERESSMTMIGQWSLKTTWTAVNEFRRIRAVRSLKAVRHCWNFLKHPGTSASHSACRFTLFETSLIFGPRVKSFSEIHDVQHCVNITFRLTFFMLYLQGVYKGH